MRLLLDTHILLWALADDARLPAVARSLIEDRTNLVMYSVAAVWEVEIKHGSRPDQMLIGASELVEYCDKAWFESLALANRHVMALGSLQRPKEAVAHNDPFDRIMLAQAKSDGLVFVTHDSLIPGYNESCVLSV